MAFSQSLQQIQDKGANADLISLFKDSGADLDWVWGETKPLAPGGAQYVIKMSPANLEIIRNNIELFKNVFELVLTFEISFFCESPHIGQRKFQRLLFFCLNLSKLLEQRFIYFTSI